MSTEDNDNIYILEENPVEEEQDNSPMNFAAYSDDERLREENEEKEISKRSNVYGLLFKIMFNPVEGWKELRRSKLSIEELQSSCFYPLLAILAICQFADYIYSVNVNLTEVVSQAVITFVAFFFGFFSIKMVLSWLLPEEVMEKFYENYGNQYLLVSMSTLALFTIIRDLLPMLWPILIFLPIWTFYIMFKGLRFLKLPSGYEMKFYVLSCIAIVGVPYGIDLGLNLILPI